MDQLVSDPTEQSWWYTWKVPVIHDIQILMAAKNAAKKAKVKRYNHCTLEKCINSIDSPVCVSTEKGEAAASAGVAT